MAEEHTPSTAQSASNEPAQPAAQPQQAAPASPAPSAPQGSAQPPTPPMPQQPQNAAGHVPSTAPQATPVPPRPAQAAGQQVPPSGAQQAPGQPSAGGQPPVGNQPVPPMPQPPFGAPAMVPSLTGGLKFGYFALGFLGNLLGVLIAWLINADKHPEIRNGAIKWSVIGFAATFVLGILFSLLIAGFVGSVMAAVGASAYDAGSVYNSYHGAW